MTTSKNDLNKAFSLLSQFERQLIDPAEFRWNYITNRVKASKATLWRNYEFRKEFTRVKDLVKDYKAGFAEYSLEKSKESVKDQEIAKLKAKIRQLESELNRERERLAYAAMVARRRNIDPNDFLEESPLMRAKSFVKQANVVRLKDKNEID